MINLIDDAYKMRNSLDIYSKQGLNDIYVPIRGIVTLKLRDTEGNILRTENHNEIIYLGRHRVAHIIFGDAAVPAGETAIKTLKVAGGAVAEGGDHFSPTQPSVTDPGMFETDPLKIKTFSFDAPVFTDVAATEAPIVTLTKTIVCTDVNLLVNEFGAFFGETGPMFAHYTCSTLDLRESAGTGLEIIWQFLL